jgi:hypothetical protein
MKLNFLQIQASLRFSLCEKVVSKNTSVYREKRGTEMEISDLVQKTQKRKVRLRKFEQDRMSSPFEAETS